jgi:hypothetical protein
MDERQDTLDVAAVEGHDHPPHDLGSVRRHPPLSIAEARILFDPR